MTRIVAGTAKGRTIKVPDQGTRPTSAKVREALFSKLDNWNLLEDSAILDLFAGSGALGLEALSRGAAQVVFVDNSRSAIAVVKSNLATLSLRGRTQCVASDAKRYLEGVEQTFDVIFVDPPYALAEQELSALLGLLVPRLTPEGLIIVERDTRSPQPALPPGLELEDQRAWGDTAAWFVGHQADSA